MINPATIDAGAPSTTEIQIGRTPIGRANSGKFAIAGDKIALATAELPERQRVAIRWAERYCRQGNFSHHDLADRLKKPDGKAYSPDSVYHMFTGGREAAQLDNMVLALERLRDVEIERAGQVRVAFIETSLAQRIFTVCRRAFLRQKIVMVYGDSQIGKTSALLAYKERHNHGETKYVRMPPGGGYDPFVRELAEELGLPVHSRSEDLRRRILDCFDSRMLLIVDECEECLVDRPGSTKGVTTLNFIREIHDKKKCGIVLAGANIFKRRLLHGHNSPSMQRLIRRGMIPLQLPANPPQADLALFAVAYGLPAARADKIGVRVTSVDDEGNVRTGALEHSPFDLQNRIVREHGLGRWVMILQEASDIARERRKAISWGLVLHAWHSFEQDASFEASPPATGGEEADA